MPRFKDVAANLGVTAAGVIAALAIAELALRLCGISYPPPSSFLQPDPDLGWSHRANLTMPNPLEGFRGDVTFNRAGLRDGHEFAISKPLGTFRIAMLGDSFTEALQVPEEQDFCSIAEHAMAGCAGLHGLKTEVMNFGVMGYGTGQELIKLRRDVWKWSPDAIVLVFYTNDVADNTRATDAWERTRGSSLGPRPFFSYENGRLAEDDSFRQSARFREFAATGEWGKRSHHGWRRHLLLHSRVWQLFYHLRHAPIAIPLVLQRAPSDAKAVSQETGNDHPSDVTVNGTDPFRLEAGVLAPPRDADWIEAWRVTERLLEQISQEARSHGAKFLLVIASDPLQVYPDPSVRRRYLGNGDSFYQNHRLEDLGARSGFEVLSLAEPLQRFADEHHVFLHGFSGGPRGWGHWNAEGHRLAGEMIADRLCAMLSAGRPSQTGQPTQPPH